MPLKTVLLVEPDRYHHEILSGALEHNGYLVVAVLADELPDVLHSPWRPDLLVAAFPASLSDGRSLFDWVRATGLTRNIPVLCVSENAEPWHLEQAREIGCRAVCVKPFEAAHFAVQVRQLVGPSVRE